MNGSVLTQNLLESPLLLNPGVTNLPPVRLEKKLTSSTGPKMDLLLNNGRGPKHNAGKNSAGQLIQTPG
jgi:hypothetical protein